MRVLFFCVCYRVHPGGDGRDVACGVAAGCLEQHYFKIKNNVCYHDFDVVVRNAQGENAMYVRQSCRQVDLSRGLLTIK